MVVSGSARVRAGVGDLLPRPVAREARVMAIRARRPPPPFRPVEVARVERRTPRMVRVWLAGGALEGLVVDEPAASIRLLVPSPGAAGLVVPEWSGNEFLLPGGRRPLIRTFTPSLRAASDEALFLDVVDHPAGSVAAWARAAAPGAPAAVSGPGRGHRFDGSASALVLLGDESALPAAAQLVAARPPDLPVVAVFEVADRAAILGEVEAGPGVEVRWVVAPEGAPPGTALVEAARDLVLPAGGRIWAAGEAAAMQRLRRSFFEDRGVDRRATTIRGYWKHGRAGDEPEEGEDPARS
ncbi:MAG: siderophore-interacting protein [Acidimicrobiia bacterium]